MHVVQVILQEAHTPAMDIFSLGVLLHVILVGRLPMSATDAARLSYYKTDAWQYESMQSPHWKALSITCKDLLLMMLDRDPAKRPTAAQVRVAPVLLSLPAPLRCRRGPAKRPPAAQVRVAPVLLSLPQAAPCCRGSAAVSTCAADDARPRPRPAADRGAGACRACAAASAYVLRLCCCLLLRATAALLSVSVRCENVRHLLLRVSDPIPLLCDERKQHRRDTHLRRGRPPPRGRDATQRHR